MTTYYRVPLSRHNNCPQCGSAKLKLKKVSIWIYNFKRRESKVVRPELRWCNNCNLAFADQKRAFQLRQYISSYTPKWLIVRADDSIAVTKKRCEIPVDFGKSAMSTRSEISSLYNSNRKEIEKLPKKTEKEKSIPHLKDYSHTDSDTEFKVSDNRSIGESENSLPAHYRFLRPSELKNQNAEYILNLEGKKAFTAYQFLSIEEKHRYLEIVGFNLSSHEGRYFPLLNTIVINELINPFTNNPIMLNLDMKTEGILIEYCKKRLYQKNDDETSYYVTVELFIDKRPSSIDEFFSWGVKYTESMPANCRKAADNPNAFFYHLDTLFKIEKELNYLEDGIIPVHRIQPGVFVTRTKVPYCIHQHHKIRDIYGIVPVINKNGDVNNRAFIGAYCEDCNTYYMFESEYKKLKKEGYIACAVVERNFWRSGKTGYFDNMTPESKLHMYGYNVNASIALSENQRHVILEMIINNGLLTRFEICAHIQMLINLNKHLPSHKDAVKKWTKDLEYLKLFVAKKAEVVKVEKIIHRNYVEK